MNPYPVYKDSGIDWLGQIPAHWDVRRARYIFREVDERSAEGKEELLSVSHITGVTPRSEKNVTMFMAESYAGYKLCRPDDLVVNTMWAWMTALGISRYYGIVSTAYTVYRFHSPEIVCARYYDFLLRIPGYAGEYLCRSKGIWTSRLLLNSSDFNDIPIILPPIEEQRAIVAYLDRKNAQIDTFVAKKRRLIELLQEQRAALIHEAVTRGLDSNAEILILDKDSGASWLGAIPKHWDVRRLKFVANVFVSNVDKHSVEGECPVHLCNYTDVYYNTKITRGIPFMKATATIEQIVKFSLRVGDVIITKDSEMANDIAVPALVAEELPGVVCGYHLAILRPKENILGAFLRYILTTPVVRDHFCNAANGVTRVGLSRADILTAPIIVPPVEEQAAIVAHIERETATIDRAIARIQREIELLAEYRTALIAEAVTGKIRVCGV